MGQATDRLTVKLAAAVLVPAHTRISRGRRVHVEAYRRDGKDILRKTLGDQELSSELAEWGTDRKIEAMSLRVGQKIAHNNGVHEILSKTQRPATFYIDVKVRTLAGKKATNLTFDPVEPIRMVSRRRGIMGRLLTKPLKVRLAVEEDE